MIRISKLVSKRQKKATVRLNSSPKFVFAITDYPFKKYYLGTELGNEKDLSKKKISNEF